MAKIDPVTMTHVKTLILLLITAALALPEGRAQKKPLVVASASIFADMAEIIGGGLVEVRTIVPIGGDPHIYEPSPADAQLAADADLILCNGLTFEGWLRELIANSGTKAPTVTVTKGIEPIRSQQYKNSTDPHAWMDARNGLIYIENIRNALMELDPGNRDVYDFNYGVYKQQLEDLDRYIGNRVREIPEARRILITSHDAFRYYGRRYGIRVEAVLGTSTDADAQTSDILRLNRIIRENQVPVVFIETTVNPKLLNQLAVDNHIGIGGKLFSDSIGDKNSPAPSYTDMLRYNTDTIVEALKGNQPLTEKNLRQVSNVWLYIILSILLLGGAGVLFWRLS